MTEHLPQISNHTADRPARRRTAISGAAGEAGGNYRAGIAAYIAAHGMANAPIPLLTENAEAYPVSLVIEADTAVDDISCELSDDTRVLLQAKRSLGLNDRLREAIDQCIAHIVDGDLQDGDRLVIVGEEMSGPAKDLGRALSRHRRPLVQSATTKEQEALTWLRSYAKDRMDSNELRLLERSLLVVNAPWDEEQSSLAREAGYLLDSAVVNTGSGRAAIDDLESSMRKQGEDRYGSRLDDWIATLRAKRVLISDKNGTVAAKRVAIDAEIVTYTKKHAARLDQIILSKLPVTVPRLEIQGYLWGFTVNLSDEVRDVRLTHVVKRWRRLCLVGWPGAGKSTALEQLAASWVSEERGPIPVLLSLRRLADACKDRDDTLSPEESIAAAAHFVSSSNRGTLAPELLSMLHRGEAGLLLDGLDECGAQRGPVVEALGELISSSDDSCPIVLSTRHSALPAAKILKLPTVYLQEPENLDQNIETLVEHICRYAHNIEPSSPFVKERKRWIAQSRSTDSILWKVPLLATLGAIAVCNDPRLGLPTNRTELLRRTVDLSIREWENKRETHPEAYQWLNKLGPRYLIESFPVIGHELVEGRNNVAQVSASLQLFSQVSFDSSVSASKEEAEQCLRFWDEVVGIYLIDYEEDSVSTRTRLFSELGDALWVVDPARTPDARSQWLRNRADNPDQTEPIRLAAQLESAILDDLIEYAVASERWDLIRTGLEIMEDRIDPAPETAFTLLKALGAAIRHTPRSTPLKADDETSPLELLKAGVLYDDTSWGWAVALATLRLPQSLRNRRDFVFDEKSADDQSMLGGIAAVTDAIADERALDPGDVSIVRKSLRDLAARISRLQASATAPGSSRSARFGEADFALAACRMLPQLTEADATALALAGDESSLRLRSEIEALLAEHHFGHLLRPLPPTKFSLADEFERGDRDWVKLTSLMSGLDNSDIEVDLNLIERWSLPDYCDLIDVMDFGQRGASEFRPTFRQPQALQYVMRIYSRIHNIPVTKAAAQARIAAPQLDDFALDIPQLAYCPPAPGQERHSQAFYLEADDINELVEIARSGSGHLPDLAIAVLAAAENAAAPQALLRELHGIATESRVYAARLILERMPAQREDLSSVWLAGDDSLLRYAACVMAIQRALHTLDASGAAASLSPFLSDQDWTLRSATYRALERRGAKIEEPHLEDCRYWTCLGCGRINTPEAEECSGCTRGSPNLAIYY